MLSRNIDFDEIESAIIDGEIIKEYAEDKPFQVTLFWPMLMVKPCMW